MEDHELIGTFLGVVLIFLFFVGVVLLGMYKEHREWKKYEKRKIEEDRESRLRWLKSDKEAILQRKNLLRKAKGERPQGIMYLFNNKK